MKINEGEEMTEEAKPTLYHDSVDHLRRDLMNGYAHWQEVAGRYRPESTSRSEAAAHGAALMASGYAYTLAAVLAHAARKFGPDVAHGLGGLADDILMNGDDDNINADVMPAPAAASAEGETR